jgi:carbon storage regulator
MLVLSRRRSEEIVIGGNICIRVTAINRKDVKLGISAPQEVSVVRSPQWRGGGRPAIGQCSNLQPRLVNLSMEQITMAVALQGGPGTR